MNDFNSSYFLVHYCLSQRGQNIFSFDVLKQIRQSIHLEISLSEESESFTFYENMRNGARRLTYQTLWLFLFLYERVSLLGPIGNWGIMTCSLLDFWKASLHSPKVGWI